MLTLPLFMRNAIQFPNRWCPVLKPSWELIRSTKPTKRYFVPISCDFVDRSCSVKDNTKIKLRISPNRFYGQVTIFEYPSSLRLGIKFQLSLSGNMDYKHLVALRLAHNSSLAL